ncbi:m-phase inducer phosphatase [Coemansia sp. RSA 552]|nr:m-phase inducer phosphatase [Coemansia sp. RSA 552]
MNTVASDRLSSPYMRGLTAASNPFAAVTPSRPRGGASEQASAELSEHSPVASLVKDLNSSLHLDHGSTPTKATPAMDSLGAPSPFEAQGTPLLLRSRKRQIDDMGSPAVLRGLNADSPSIAVWGRSQGGGRLGRGRRAPLLADSPSCGSSSRQPLLFRRESLNTDEDSSFDDDGSLTSLPRMRGSTVKSIMEGRALECTPVRPQGSAIKRARSRTAAVSGFQPISETDEDSIEPAGELFGLNFSPSARSQPECHSLPCFTAPTDSIMRIEAETASRLLAGDFDRMHDERIIVDCRFPYEYEGGHIAGAVNAPTLEALEELLLNRPRSDKRVVVVLHCEYSIQRAPSMASHLRRRDREVNMHRYPYLHYPEIYVIKGGYRNFFNFHKPQCEPQNYIEMNDRAFAVDCRQRMLQFNRQFKRTKSMNDAALSRSYSAATLPGSMLFMQSPTNMPSRSSSSSSSLPSRARRLARTQSARPGINLIDFSQK